MYVKITNKNFLNEFKQWENSGYVNSCFYSPATLANFAKFARSQNETFSLNSRINRRADNSTLLCASLIDFNKQLLKNKKSKKSYF